MGYILITVITLTMFTGFLSGCISVDDTKLPDDSGVNTANEMSNAFFEKSHVVVAYIDSGINPYHQQFRRPDMMAHPSAYISDYPADSIPLNLTFGDSYQQNVRNDTATFSEVERGSLYWIPGTPVIGAVSFSQDYVLNLVEADGLPILSDSSDHGNSVASTILNNNQEVLLVVIEAGSKDLAEAMNWAAEQPWIDIISSSFGLLTGVEVPEPVFWSGVSEAIKKAYDSGKILTQGAGNRIMPPWFGDTAGPPQIINVGGFDYKCKGDALIAAKSPDFTSDFSVLVANNTDMDGYDWHSGTSYSGPTVAATISKTLLSCREKLNYTGEGAANGNLIDLPAKDISLTNSMFRDAFNKTALYVSTADYDPTQFEQHDLLLFILDIPTPILPGAPFIQMGWGYVGPEIVNDTVDILLGKTQYEPSLEKQLAEPYMDAVYELRKTFWGNWPLGEEEYNRLVEG
ncbi:MAG: hypothetical protein CVT48_02560 [Thermoplasmata archaeon HGW-Thermoplasmata-1]|nr:MAG: hypothetical protein CVT48_02560 [Thermoplasmata archaeon HGW-Thermoplasmata-1]